MLQLIDPPETCRLPKQSKDHEKDSYRNMQILYKTSCLNLMRNLVKATLRAIRNLAVHFILHFTALNSRLRRGNHTWNLFYLVFGLP